MRVEREDFRGDGGPRAAALFCGPQNGRPGSPRPRVGVTSRGAILEARSAPSAALSSRPRPGTTSPSPGKGRDGTGRDGTGQRPLGDSWASRPRRRQATRPRAELPRGAAQAPTDTDRQTDSQPCWSPGPRPAARQAQPGPGPTRPGPAWPSPGICPLTPLGAAASPTGTSGAPCGDLDHHLNTYFSPPSFS